MKEELSLHVVLHPYYGALPVMPHPMDCTSRGAALLPVVPCWLPASLAHALGGQDPAGKAWLSGEEAINLGKLEKSSKEETAEPAAPPLLC